MKIKEKLEVIYSAAIRVVEIHSDWKVSKAAEAVPYLRQLSVGEEQS